MAARSLRQHRVGPPSEAHAKVRGHAMASALTMVLAVLVLAPPAQPLPLPLENRMQDATAPGVMESALRQMRNAQRLPAYRSLPEAQQRLVQRYMQALLTPILNGARCNHDLARWQRFLAERASGSLIPTSEVLACPSPASR